MSASRRLGPEDPALADVLALIREAFAEHDGRIDPPSSARRPTSGGVAAQAGEGEVWAIGEPPEAAVFLTPRPACLSVGKLAVRADRRRRGLARTLPALAEDRARARGLPALELQTRVELASNHAAFAALGFERVGETAHEGHDRPTSVTFRRAVTTAQI